MIQIHVYQMERFLEVVDQCSGPVRVSSGGGEILNLNKNPPAQVDLQRQYLANGRKLSLSLDIPQPKDYLRLVYYTVGDCGAYPEALRGISS